MRASQQLSLVGFLLFFLLPAHLCEICEASNEQQASLAPLMATMIQSRQPSPEADSSILIALELARQYDQKAETAFLNVVKQNILQRETLTSGQLALIILALTAACQTSFVAEYKLVKSLEEKFQKEIDSIDTSGQPLTNYYELGLDVLALCLLNGTYSSSKIAKLFSAEQRMSYISGQFFVDTGALAVLALTCVNRQSPDKIISKNILWLVEKILKEKKQDGTIGDIYSTGEAMQALFVTPEYYKKEAWDCNQTLNTVLSQISQGTFSLPIAAAQVLPALEGKTYLDVTHVSCQSRPGHLNISTPKPTEPTHQSKNISVTYSVVDSINNNINESTIISVPKDSVFLKVMEAAQAQNYSKFWFTIESSEWGAYVTSVHGIQASSKNRTYWELLNNHQPLSQGAGSFVVSDGDNLEVRLSQY
ncbi:transcobalamin-1 isoform X2 [Phascolarctos cinereus]|uniref:Transcobalamin-1 isoform X2 n=1 Tax=Phascolarctos cinereus TaxID=38626 RepID=A0A6P5JBY8_PHACI|nr:transcobalamin-1 isoform X2 [Phascolarctos cinereus]